MALIVFHAGMSKSGSTSLQHWLARNLSVLDDRGLEVLRIRQPSPAAPITLVPATASGVTSRLVPGANDAATRPAAVEELCAALDERATAGGDLLLTSESYEIVFQRAEPAVLAHLDALARRHTVRVAYYVRPQHEWLESAWGQWGFRQPIAPAVWLRRQESRIDYFGTLGALREQAPHVSFEIRPVRRDLLAGGSVVTDFARTFVGADVACGDSEPRAANRSLPLDVTILLRDAPPGLFWSSIHDNKRFYRLKELVLQWDVPESAAVAQSRMILRRYARETFEARNRELVAALGWPTDHFITPVDDRDPGETDDLARLDDLWRTDASEAQRHLVYRALDALLAASEPGGGAR